MYEVPTWSQRREPDGCHLRGQYDLWPSSHRNVLSVSLGHGKTPVCYKLGSALSDCVIACASQLVILVGSHESGLEPDAAGQGCTHDDAKYQRQRH